MERRDLVVIGFGDKAEKQKSKELKNELKQYKKSLCEAGIDKTTAGGYIKDLQETLENAARIRKEYQAAKGYFLRAYERMEHMLEEMDRQTEGEIGINLETLVEELHLSVHDCLLREDDMDFVSSRDGLERMAESGTFAAPGMSIMLRSELENLYAVFSDVKEWQEPDFFSFAYYLLHEDRASLQEIGNDRMVHFVAEYEEQYFKIPFFEICRMARITEQVQQTIQDYIYGEFSFEK